MFGVHSQRDRGAGTEPGQQQAERSRTAVGTAVVDRFVAAQRMASVLMRTPYGVSSLVTVAVAMVWSRSSLITPSSQPETLVARGPNFIVTVMKPVVHVPWYQVLPWILSGGTDS